MTVAELIRELQALPPSARIRVEITDAEWVLGGISGVVQEEEGGVTYATLCI